MEGPDNPTLAQGQVLEGELAVAADEEGKEPEYVQYEGDHEPGLWLASADRSIAWLADDVLARDRDHSPRTSTSSRRPRAGANDGQTTRFLLTARAPRIYPDARRDLMPSLVRRRLSWRDEQR